MIRNNTDQQSVVAGSLVPARHRVGALQFIDVKTRNGDEYIVNKGDVVVTITRLRHGQPVCLQDGLGRQFVLITSEQWDRVTAYYDECMLAEELAGFGKRQAKEG